MGSSIIKHQGIVQDIKNNQLEVMIISESACSSCKSKKICSISEAKEKLIYIESIDNSFHIGDKVTVFLEERMGAYAVIFAYLFPFIVMVLSLFIGYFNNASEPIMGLSVLASLSLYFGIVYLFRKQLGKRITFKVEKQINPTS